MPLIGLSDFHYAVLTDATDTPTVAAAYGTPVAVAGISEANIKPKVDSTTLYGDDGPIETASSFGEIDVDISLGSLPLETQAALLGHTVNNGVLVKKSSDVAPYVAIGFKAQKSNGKYRFIWLYKGKFELQEQGYKTKEDKVTFQNAKLTGKFVKRTNDAAWQKIGDEDATGWAAPTGGWFSAVI